LTTMTGTPVTNFPLRLAWRGKVRDVFHVDETRLLLVTSDRISAFDVVLDDPIPHKGVVLTQLTAWWLRHLEGRVDNHLISSDTDEIIHHIPSLEAYRGRIDGRAMLCWRAEVFPVECVIRGYMAGSAWKEYKASGTLAGEVMPPFLRESDALSPPLFSPATKAMEGHDENITIPRMREIVGANNAAELERLTRQIYEIGSSVAAEKGIIIADTSSHCAITWMDCVAPGNGMVKPPPRACRRKSCRSPAIVISMLTAA
jgi:phosphoribosylaminoimidazole-succinocarboxamide synthase